MKPPTIWPFVPPVTGAGGNAASVNSNKYDDSRNFPQRPRFNSFKRSRPDYGEGEQSPYDLTRDYPPLAHPPPPLSRHSCSPKPYGRGLGQGSGGQIDS